MASSIDFIIKIQDEVTPKIDALTKKVEGLQGQFDAAKKHAETFGETLKGISELLIEVFAVEKIFEWGKEAFNETVKLQKAQEGLAMAVENTNAKNGATLEQLKEQTEELRKHSDFAKVDIVAAQARIALVGLSREAQEKANKVALDYAAQQSLMGRETSPVEAAAKLERALVNVKGATRLLAEEGIALTTQQKKQLQAFVDTGQKAKAQQIILDALAQHTEGAAERMLAADPMGRLKLGMENLSEKVGPLLLRVFEKLEPLLERIIDGASKLFDWLDKNKVVIGAIVKALIPLAGTAAILWGIEKATLAWEAAQIALDVALDANPIGAIILGIALLGGAIYELIDNFPAVEKAFDDFFNDLGDSSTRTAKIIGQYWTALGDIIEGVFNPGSGQYTRGLNEFADANKALAAEYHRELGDDVAKTTTNPNEKTGKGIKPKGQPTDALLGGSSTGSSSSKGPTQIYITIGKFGETHIETKNFHEAPAKMHDAILQSLTEALNDSQNIATRPS